MADENSGAGGAELQKPSAATGSLSSDVQCRPIHEMTNCPVVGLPAASAGGYAADVKRKRGRPPHGFDNKTQEFLCLCEKGNVTTFCKDHNVSHQHSNRGVVAVAGAIGIGAEIWFWKNVSCADKLSIMEGHREVHLLKKKLLL